MALVIADRVKETTTTTGTGDIALGGPVSGYRPFSVIGNGNTTFYVIATPNEVAWEVGIGTFNAALNTLARTTVLSSSNSNALVDFPSGAKIVALTQAAGAVLYLDGTTLTGVNGSSGFTFVSPSFSGAPINAGSMRGSIVDVPALNVDCSAGNYFRKTITTNSTFTFGSAPAGVMYNFILEVNLTSGSITFPTTVRWPGGVAPSLSTNRTHLFMFLTDDGGTIWRGSYLTNYAVT